MPGNPRFHPLPFRESQLHPGEAIDDDGGEYRRPGNRGNLRRLPAAGEKRVPGRGPRPELSFHLREFDQHRAADPPVVLLFLCRRPDCPADPLPWSSPSRAGISATHGGRPGEAPGASGRPGSSPPSTATTRCPITWNRAVIRRRRPGRRCPTPWTWGIRATSPGSWTSTGTTRIPSAGTSGAQASRTMRPARPSGRPSTGSATCSTPMGPSDTPPGSDT